VRRDKRAVSIEALGTVDLPACQAEAYEALRARPGLTARELEEYTGQRGVWRRLSELEGFGLVSAGEPRVCRVTGRRATPWMVEAAPKVAPPKARRVSAGELQRQVDAMKAAVDYMAKRLKEESARRKATESALFRVQAGRQTTVMWSPEMDGDA
jgi:hypothetical protein